VGDGKLPAKIKREDLNAKELALLLSLKMPDFGVQFNSFGSGEEK
jgi:hypothetical protein